MKKCELRIVKGYVALACSVVLNATSSILFKLAAVGADKEITSLFLNKWYIGGLGLLFIQSLTWIAALRQIPLSRSYPMISLIFPLGLVSGWLFFNEEVSRNNLLGVFLIMIGVVLVQRPQVVK